MKAKDPPRYLARSFRNSTHQHQVLEILHFEVSLILEFGVGKYFGGVREITFIVLH